MDGMTLEDMTRDWSVGIELLSSQEHIDFLKQLVSDARLVKVEPLANVVGRDRAREIIHAVRPQKNECYKNATLLSLADKSFKYVEGRVSAMAFPIDHAFNVIDGHYVDITLEYVLGKDVTSDSYIVIGEYEQHELMRATLENGFYGGVYDFMYKERINQSNQHGKTG